jgi:restriction system protein
MSHEIELPTRFEMMNPLIQALHQLGGSGTNDEIEATVAKIMNLSDEQLQLMHNPERNNQTAFSYRLAWTRTYLKKTNILENPKRGIWKIADGAEHIKQIDPKTVNRQVLQQDREARDTADDTPLSYEDIPVKRDDVPNDSTKA